MYWFSRANQFSSWKVDKFTLLTHSFVDWNLENLYKQAVGSDGKREKERSAEMIWNESVLGSFKELAGTLTGQLFPMVTIHQS